MHQNVIPGWISLSTNLVIFQVILKFLMFDALDIKSMIEKIKHYVMS